MHFAKDGAINKTYLIINPDSYRDSAISVPIANAHQETTHLF
jgi:hypothetical protein